MVKNEEVGFLKSKTMFDLEKLSSPIQEKPIKLQKIPVQKAPGIKSKSAFFR